MLTFVEPTVISAMIVPIVIVAVVPATGAVPPNALARKSTGTMTELEAESVGATGIGVAVPLT